METWTGDPFDIIWLDADHAYKHVSTEIRAARRILAPGGILAGDDYWWDSSTQGVFQAVNELLPQHCVVFDRIWFSRPA